jgi:hypothetical protein
MALEWLYPELKQIAPKDRPSALQKAKDTSFDIIELVGIGAALILVVVLTRYSVTGIGALRRMGAALSNFLVAVPLMLIFAGPFYVRRTRRGLREYIEKQSRRDGDQSR